MTLKEQYLHWWPTLATGLICLALCAITFFFIDPSVIQQLPPQNTYFLLYALLYLGLSLVLSFILLNSRRGFLLGTFCIAALWLSQVRLFSLPIIGVLAVALLFIELLLTLRG
jgi:hypothetical protein